MNEKMDITEDLKQQLWQVPVSIDLIENTNLSDKSFRLYLMLLGYARTKNTCFPARETLAKKLNCTTRYIDTLKNELKENGLLLWHHEKGSDGRLHNHYLLCAYKPISGERKIPPRENRGSRHERSGVLGNNTNINNTNINNSYNIRTSDSWDEPTLAVRENINNNRTTSGTEGFASDVSALELEDEDSAFDFIESPASKIQVSSFLKKYMNAKNQYGFSANFKMDKHIENLYSASEDIIEWYLEDDTRFLQFFAYCDDKSFNMQVRSWECYSLREPTVMVNESVYRRYKEWLEVRNE